MEVYAHCCYVEETAIDIVCLLRVALECDHVIDRDSLGRARVSSLENTRSFPA